ncbi:MAG TPA: HAD family hydrolase [Thermomicrobiales bacterium]
MQELRGVLLDVDGTLVDSNDAHAHAWVQALVEGGFDVPFERVRHLIGMGGDNLLPEVTGLEKETSQGQRMSTRWTEIFREKYLSTLQPFPQCRALVERLRAAGLRVVISSSSEEEMLGELLKNAGVTDLLDATTSSGDAEQSKPDPDLIEVALAKGHLTRDTAVMIGDTPYDIQAASKAGVGTIAFRCGGWSDRDLAAAIAIYDDPADLLAHFDESPLAHRDGA